MSASAADDRTGEDRAGDDFELALADNDGDIGAAIDAAISKKRRRSKNLVDAITGAPLKRREAINLESLRPSLVDAIRQRVPDLPSDGYISRKSADSYRGRYMEDLLQEERGALSVLEKEVVESLQTHDTLAENIEDDYEDHRSIGDRMADAVASFGGSWTFITSFFAFLAVWMMINLVMGANNAFDAYPFILLNLVLSTIAAFQAPIIMMSQRRQESKDRLRALNDYKVNLKAELEIRHLHEKIDHLLNRQWERLMEIQQIQIEVVRDQAKKTERALKAIKRPKAEGSPKKKSAVRGTPPSSEGGLSD